MKISDILTEVFDTKWDLAVTPISQHVYADLKNRGLGSGGLLVWSKKDEPNQVIYLINNDGYWEVHHQLMDNEGNFISGERLDSKSGGGSKINTGLFATAIDLYKRCLSRGRRIRVTAPRDLWDTYNKVIDRIIDEYDGRLVSSKVDDNYKSSDGKIYSARTLQFEGRKMNISPMKILK